MLMCIFRHIFIFEMLKKFKKTSNNSLVDTLQYPLLKTHCLTYCSDLYRMPIYKHQE